MAERFLVRRGEFWSDGWTYGDWHQYVCERPDGSTQCARVSRIPLFMEIFGACAVAIVLAVLWSGYNDPILIHADRLALAGGIAAFMLGVSAGLRVKGAVLMVAVGPRQYEGKRVFFDEVR